jgi:hypothetical protein
MIPVGYFILYKKNYEFPEFAHFSKIAQSGNPAED